MSDLLLLTKGFVRGFYVSNNIPKDLINTIYMYFNVIKSKYLINWIIKDKELNKIKLLGNDESISSKKLYIGSVPFCIKIEPEISNPNYTNIYLKCDASMHNISEIIITWTLNIKELNYNTRNQNTFNKFPCSWGTASNAIRTNDLKNLDNITINMSFVILYIKRLDGFFIKKLYWHKVLNDPEYDDNWDMGHNCSECIHDSIHDNLTEINKSTQMIKDKITFISRKIDTIETKMDTIQKDVNILKLKSENKNDDDTNVSFDIDLFGDSNSDTINDMKNSSSNKKRQRPRKWKRNYVKRRKICYKVNRFKKNY
mmetsp:Transcript_30230/g.37077  ORF Transcript_30230/g.37077 Transcript_30230/m.37077 type:complete len:313 (-) Transcript_30230:83-1021(-)